ncbi:MAG: hypothetical protein ACJ74Z_02185 [Bryobacteraceae bacterium]
MTVVRSVATAILACCAVPCLYADFSYQQTTRVTGGAMVGMMKFAGAFSKDARKAMDPIKSTTSIKGNRMVHRTADSASVIDLDKETITEINYAKKTYSVATFAQIKQAMDQMAEKAREQKGNSTEQKGTSGEQVDMHFDVKVNDTGQSKVINGNNAHRMIMTMTMQGADAKSGAKGGIDMTTDMWIAPQVSGYEEVRHFYRRMSEKLEWTPGANPIMMSRPDMARAMAQLYKEGVKLDGMPVYETIKMGGKMEGSPNASGSESQSESQSQRQASRDSAPPPTSVTGALGAALGGRLGGFGHHKKQAAPPDSDSNAPAGPAGSGNAAATGPNSASGSLIEMTTEVLSYSSGPADAAGFEVPSGFSQVQEPLHPSSAHQ